MANKTLPSGAVQLTVNQADIDRIVKRLDKWKDRPLQERERKAIQGALSLLVGPIRAQTPEITRRLWSSVKVRKLRSRGVTVGGLSAGEVAAYAAGPTARYRHLVIRGHRIVTRGGRDTGRRSRKDPFVDRAVDPLEGQLRSFIDNTMKGF